MKKVFIDGSAGTTGLRIFERLSVRKDISLIVLDEEVRKDPASRMNALNEADIAFLCLPDTAAIEAVSMISSCSTVVIDTSTAHRCNDSWTYGFPEISGQRNKVSKSNRIANPGCHASGFIALIAPLVDNKFISPDVSLVCTSITGYSGGGKKMIAEYESSDVDSLLVAPRQYGINQNHKHLPEMVKMCGLKSTPAFIPIVAPFYSGMEVTVPLFRDQLSTLQTKESLIEFYCDYYKNGLVFVNSHSDENGFLSAAAFSGKDSMEISVFGNDQRIILTARFDNLGKGASGAAIQNMNIVLGIEESTGLII